MLVGGNTFKSKASQKHTQGKTGRTSPNLVTHFSIKDKSCDTQKNVETWTQWSNWKRIIRLNGHTNFSMGNQDFQDGLLFFICFAVYGMRNKRPHGFNAHLTKLRWDISPGLMSRHILRGSAPLSSTQERIQEQGKKLSDGDHNRNSCQSAHISKTCGCPVRAQLHHHQWLESLSIAFLVVSANKITGEISKHQNQQRAGIGK